MKKAPGNHLGAFFIWLAVVLCHHACWSKVGPLNQRRALTKFHF